MSNKVTETRQLLWLPNAITSLRYFFAIAIFITATNHLWKLSFIFILIAIGTDFLDGFAAKKLNAQTHFGAELDRIADLALVLSGLTSLAVTMHVSWWPIAIATAGVVWGETLPTPRWWPNKIIAVTYLFMAWTIVVWYYADLGFGWSWIYIPITVGVLSFCAYFKKHRIRAWLHNQS
jgi:phosphatidylglycerophosphate synthase